MHSLPKDRGEVGPHNFLPRHVARIKKINSERAPSKRYGGLQKRENAQLQKAAYDEEVNSIYVCSWGHGHRCQPLHKQVLDVLKRFNWELSNLTSEVGDKASFVVIGDQEKDAEDKESLYSPVSVLTTVKVAVSVALKKSWSIQQADVSPAFLNASLDGEVYLNLAH